MERHRYFFAGNRFFVLQKMLELNLPLVRIFAVPDSFLERELQRNQIPFEKLTNKQKLVETLQQEDFEFFISNGCPHILPVSLLQQGNNKIFVNIHPSLLPELRGADPVPGALLHRLTSGATCHLMNDSIDDGDIIAQVAIEMTSCLDSGLLYQLSFMAEREVFLDGYQRNFQPSVKQFLEKHNVYYTFREKDLEISFGEGSEYIVSRVKAFNTHSKGAYFYHRDQQFKVFDAEEVNNPYLLQRIENYKENEVVFKYEGKLLIRKDVNFLKLKQIHGDLSYIKIGDILGQ